MQQIGIVKKFDKLGRLVIPIALRRRYDLPETVEIIATKEGILLRKPVALSEKSTKDAVHGSEP